RAEAVGLGGVEEVDADVERVADGAGELPLVAVAVAAAHLLAAEPDRRDLLAGGAEKSSFHHASRQRTGRRLIPPFTAELSRSTGPVTSNESRRATRWRDTVCISSRARCAPMQKCCPMPNARCGFGSRSMRKENGSSNTSSSRFADAKKSATLSPS